MTLIHRLFFIDDKANKRRPNMSNPSMNISNTEVDSQVPAENFLDQVVFRVEFTKEIDHSEKLAQELHDRIEAIFPEKKNAFSSILEAKIQAPEKVTQMQRMLVGPKVTQTQRTLVLPNFTDSTKRKHLYFEPQALVIRQDSSYTRFSAFYEMIETGIRAFAEVYGKDIIVSRVVLQYVNNIKAQGPPLDWTGMIRDELISVLDFPSPKTELSRGMNLIELTREGYRVRFQSGLFNVDYPNPIQRKEFILDYACYSTQESKIEQAIDLAKTFHGEIKKLFRASILGSLKSRFEGLEDEE